MVEVPAGRGIRRGSGGVACGFDLGELWGFGRNVRPGDRRGRVDIGVRIADVQGRQDAEGCRQSGSRVMTLQRLPTATGDSSNCLHVEFSRLLSDEGGVGESGYEPKLCWPQPDG